MARLSRKSCWQIAPPLFALAILCAAAPMFSRAGAAPAEAKLDAPGRSKSASSQPSDDNQQYCANIANVTAAARLAAQQKQLGELNQQLQKRLTELEAKRAELQELVDRYDDFIKKSDEALVNVYSKMKPEAAATQLTNLDEDSAAALLLRLKPKNSSAILSEMDSFHAALLAKKIAIFSSMKPGAKKL